MGRYCDPPDPVLPERIIALDFFRYHEGAAAGAELGLAPWYQIELGRVAWPRIRKFLKYPRSIGGRGSVYGGPCYRVGIGDAMRGCKRLLLSSGRCLRGLRASRKGLTFAGQEPVEIDA